MTVPTAGFFSWTARRVCLPRTLQGVDYGSDAPAGLTMECDLPSALRPIRLVAYHDDEGDYVSLVVGDAVGTDDVPVHAVPEEQLLLDGARSRASVEILVGVPDGRDLRAQQQELDRQLCIGGPLRSMLAYSGARSVVVGWYRPAV